MNHSLRSFLAATIVGAALLGAVPARAQIAIDIDVFHDRLSPYGRWVDHDRYGAVWTPYRRDWRPYSEGRWVYTEDYGWLWLEEDDWGWATEHYGRWFFDDAIGWLWLPGFEWAPAWVSWRSAPEYIGWAPLAPRGWRYDDDFDRRRWHFVRGDRFLASNVRTVLVEPSRNAWLIQRVPVTGEVRKSRGRWENRGLETALVERATRKPVKHVRVRQVERPQRAAVERETVSVFRPEVRQRDDRPRAQRDRRDERATTGKRAPEARQQRAARPARARDVELAKPEPRKVERKAVERRERQALRPQASRAEKEIAPQPATQRARAPKPQAREQAKSQPRVAREQRVDRRPGDSSARRKTEPDDAKPRGRAEGKRRD